LTSQASQQFRTIYCLLLLAALFCNPLSAQTGLETHKPFPSPAVNEPYTAQRVITSFQKLADGTQIQHERIVFTARDSAGRTWTQSEVENKDALRRDGKKYTVWVVWDPVTLTMTDWCDCNHVAWVRHYDPPLPPREHPKPVATQGRPQGVDIYIGPVNDRMRYSVEPLPPQQIMGISTTGSKAVRTVPAGKDGNDHDLTWTVQSWYAPDLKLALYTIVDDPLKGLTKYEFRDLKREEPPSSLFHVPPGYAVKDAVPLQDNSTTVPGSQQFK
jgi:hypothetical protein